MPLKLFIDVLTFPKLFLSSIKFFPFSIGSLNFTLLNFLFNPSTLLTESIVVTLDVVSSVTRDVTEGLELKINANANNNSIDKNNFRLILRPPFQK